MPETYVDVSKVTLFNYYSYTKISLGDVVWAPKDVVLAAKKFKNNGNGKQEEDRKDNNNITTTSTSNNKNIAQGGKQEKQTTEKAQTSSKSNQNKEDPKERNKGKYQPSPGTQNNNNNNDEDNFVSKTHNKNKKQQNKNGKNIQNNNSNNNNNNNNNNKQSNSNNNKQQILPSIEDLAHPARIEKICSFVSVEWQNGVVQKNIRSTDLYPVEDILDNDFCPEDFIVHTKTKKVGVIKKVDLQQRTCTVLWREINKQTMKNDFIEDKNQIAVFDLQPSETYRFRLGDIVQLLPNNGMFVCFILCLFCLLVCLFVCCYLFVCLFYHIWLYLAWFVCLFVCLFIYLFVLFSYCSLFLFFLFFRPLGNSNTNKSKRQNKMGW
jgi:hypothetical protein